MDFEGNKYYVQVHIGHSMKSMLYPDSQAFSLSIFVHMQFALLGTFHIHIPHTRGPLCPCISV